jgi:histidinol-phosphatase
VAREPFLRRATETAREACLAAGKASLRHWRRLTSVDRKPDGSPVTAADRAAEAAILRRIRASFPRHDVLAEESGSQARGSRYRWVVDPLDGTRGFARGGRMWGPLVALEEDGEVVAGAMALPALRASYWAARGLGAWRDGERVRVSSAARIEDATLSFGGVGRVLRGPAARGAARLLRTAESARVYGDLAAVAMLLDGTADAWIESGVRVWDLAAPRILVEEAGARFTDARGRPTHATGSAVAANPTLHARLLAVLSPRRV